jgi:hypothetical protein
MSRKSVIVSVLSAACLVSVMVAAWLISGLVPASQAAMATGEPLAASSATWFTLIASLFGVPLTGGAAGLVAWLMKAAPVISPKIGEAVGQHQAVLTAILSALQIASGKPAISEGTATLNGGTLAWSFKFVPTEGAK